jgi:hypothetical protein
LPSVQSLCRVLLSDARQTSVTVSSAVTTIFFAESRIRHSAKSLPSARQKTLDKEIFADPFFAIFSLPSATLDKIFAERLCYFAKCATHSFGKRGFCVHWRVQINDTMLPLTRSATSPTSIYYPIHGRHLHARPNDRRTDTCTVRCAMSSSSYYVLQWPTPIYL